MELRFRSLARSILYLTLLHAVAAVADDDDLPKSITPPAPQTGRYGLWDGMDHRSVYEREGFPEPLLVPDVGLEDSELELTWRRNQGSGRQDDFATVELQQGFGLLTLEVELPWQRLAGPDQTSQGLGNLELGARYPFYQYVSKNRVIDSTWGVTVEGGVPLETHVSHQAEIEPGIFNALKLGDYFTLQTVLSYDRTYPGGGDSGSSSFAYDFSLSGAVPRPWFPVPGVHHLVGIFETLGETSLNRENDEDNTEDDGLTGVAGFRIFFQPLGDCHISLGSGWIFPLDERARAGFHRGGIVNLILEF